LDMEAQQAIMICKPLVFGRVVKKHEALSYAGGVVKIKRRLSFSLFNIEGAYPGGVSFYT